MISLHNTSILLRYLFFLHFISTSSTISSFAHLDLFFYFNLLVFFLFTYKPQFLFFLFHTCFFPIKSPTLQFFSFPSLLHIHIIFSSHHEFSVISRLLNDYNILYDHFFFCKYSDFIKNSGKSLENKENIISEHFVNYWKWLIWWMTSEILGKFVKVIDWEWNINQQPHMS